MKVGAIIIARYNSSRFYGKVLKELHGTPALEHTYNRLSEVLSPEHIVIATSDENTDDLIAEFAHSKQWNVFRGSLSNVAERFLHAGKHMKWDYIIRTNGDNIFIDLSCLREMIAEAEKDTFDFLSNVEDRTYPKGMSIEIVRTSFYEDSLQKITGNPNYEEHVTLALYKNNWGNYRFFYNTTVEQLQGIQLALDTKEDFERIHRLISILGSRYKNYTLLDIKHAYEQLER